MWLIETSPDCRHLAKLTGNANHILDYAYQIEACKYAMES